MANDGDSLESRVSILIDAFLKIGERAAYVPVGVSARHIHISREHLDITFGMGYELVSYKPLLQPGQFAAEERLTVAGPSGVLKDVRILGPVRSSTQVELSITDCFEIGVDAYLPKGDYKEGVGGITIVGPSGSVTLDRGVIVAQRHLHTTPTLADRLGVNTGDEVCAYLGGDRSAILYGVLVRVSEDFADELHLDTDEANSVMAKSGQNALVFRSMPLPDEIYRMMRELMGDEGRESKVAGSDWYFEGKLLTETDVVNASKKGARRIRVRRGCIITPLSRERASLLSIEIIIS